MRQNNDILHCFCINLLVFLVNVTKLHSFNNLNILQQVLCQFQDFWDMLDEIDHKTWILEPDQPRRSSTNRRIALGTFTTSS